MSGEKDLEQLKKEAAEKAKAAALAKRQAKAAGAAWLNPLRNRKRSRQNSLSPKHQHPLQSHLQQLTIDVAKKKAAAAAKAKAAALAKKSGKASLMKPTGRRTSFSSR